MKTRSYKFIYKLNVIQPLYPKRIRRTATSWLASRVSGARASSFRGRVTFWLEVSISFHELDASSAFFFFFSNSLISSSLISIRVRARRNILQIGKKQNKPPAMKFRLAATISTQTTKAMRSSAPQLAVPVL